MLKRIKGKLALAFALLSLFMSACGSDAELAYEQESDNPFGQIFGLSNEISDIDESFIEAVEALTHLPAVLVPYEEYFVKAIEETKNEASDEESAVGEVVKGEYEESDELYESDDEEIAPDRPLRNPIFRLSEYEQYLYQSFLSNLDTSVLTGYDAGTTAKILVQLAINGELLAVYNLTSTSMSTEQFFEMGEMLINTFDEATRRNMANRELGDIDYREFIKLSENLGYFEHRDLFGNVHRLNFIKSDSNVWLIEF